MSSKITDKHEGCLSKGAKALSKASIIVVTSRYGDCQSRALRFSRLLGEQFPDQRHAGDVRATGKNLQLPIKSRAGGLQCASEVARRP